MLLKCKKSSSKDTTTTTLSTSVERDDVNVMNTKVSPALKSGTYPRKYKEKESPREG